jgi:hypothetical protein
MNRSHPFFIKIKTSFKYGICMPNKCTSQDIAEALNFGIFLIFNNFENCSKIKLYRFESRTKSSIQYYTFITIQNSEHQFI